MSKRLISRALPIVGASSLAWSVACISSAGNAVSDTSDGGVGPGSPPRPEDGMVTLSYTRLDDMEGTNGRISWIPPGGALGGWWETHAGPPNAPILPAQGSMWSYGEVPTPYETFPGITSAHAARLHTTQPLVGSSGFGANMLLDLEEPADEQVGLASIRGLPVDLRKYTGLTFWGMADPNLDTTTISVGLEDQHTIPLPGGACLESDGGHANCLNAFGTTVTLTGTFTQYTVDFSTFAQDPSWGYHPMPDVPDLQNTYLLIFQVNIPGGVPTMFDFWIDDLYFVNK